MLASERKNTNSNCNNNKIYIENKDWIKGWVLCGVKSGFSMEPFLPETYVGQAKPLSGRQWLRKHGNMLWTDVWSWKRMAILLNLLLSIWLSITLAPNIHGYLVLTWKDHLTGIEMPRLLAGSAEIKCCQGQGRFYWFGGPRQSPVWGPSPFCSMQIRACEKITSSMYNHSCFYIKI